MKPAPPTPTVRELRAYVALRLRPGDGPNTWANALALRDEFPPEMPVLPNGAVITDYAPDPRGGAVVMAYMSHRVHPWVTWEVDDDGTAFTGHYFATAPEAAADFELRRPKAVPS